MEIIKIQGEVQLTQRKWYSLFKKGWYKHKDLWGRKWWIRFKYPEIDSNGFKSIRKLQTVEHQREV